MFSPLTSADVTTAIGRALREAARSGEPASAFSRGQLLSAFSASRHLAVELAEFDPPLRAAAAVAAAELRSATSLAGHDGLAAQADALEAATDAHRIGDLLAAALDELRGDPAPQAADSRARLRRELRRLCDREVELLADAIEGPRQDG